MPLIPLPAVDTHNNIAAVSRPDEVEVIQVQEQAQEIAAWNLNDDVTLGQSKNAKIDPRAGSFGPEEEEEL